VLGGGFFGSFNTYGSPSPSRHSAAGGFRVLYAGDGLVVAFDPWA
jgi:conjugal transfer mating pair stabilization protein TraN